MSIFDSLAIETRGAQVPAVEIISTTTGANTQAACNFAAVPAYLKNLNQWMMWKHEARDGQGKPTKVPYQVNGKNKAKSTDPTTWKNFESCQHAYKSGQFSGIGFAVSEGDNLTCIDLDHCFTPGGQLEEWVQEIVDHFPDAYIEKSPSGDGLHIWCLGRPVRTGHKKWKRQNDGVLQGIEVYSHKSARYLTVTGEAIQPGEPGNCQGGLDWIHQERWAEEHVIPAQVAVRDGRPDIEQVRTALACIPADVYETWINVGHAIKAAGMDVDAWAHWSSKSAKFSPGECERRWPGLRPTKIGVGTIFHYAKQHGFVFSSSPVIEAKPIEVIDWSSPETYGEPLLFGEINTPELGGDFLPPIVKDYVNAVAAHTQMAVGPVAMLALAVMAACIQKRFEVCPLGDDYREPLSIWALVALPPASRKTAVLKALKGPVIEWEEQKAQELAPEIERQKTEQAIAKKRIEKLTNAASGTEERKNGK